MRIKAPGPGGIDNSAEIEMDGNIIRQKSVIIQGTDETNGGEYNNGDMIRQRV